MTQPDRSVGNDSTSRQNQLVNEGLVVSHRRDLIAQMKQTVDKLARDRATRGDLKILSRALRELRYAFKVFTPYRRHHKVTVFGSARTPADDPAYLQSVEFGRLMADAGWMVVTGAGGGVMEAAHVGAGREMSMGVNIMLPFEQAANPVISDDEKLVNLKYFFTRKLLFVKEVHSVVLCPGGFGTQDEGFETLTLIQTGKRDLMPVVLLDAPQGNYWTDWLEFIRKNLLDRGMISPEDLALFRVTDCPQVAVDEILRFYRVFDSMRYVRDRLILRLRADASQQFVDRLNDEFAGIVAKGRIEKTTAHAHEVDETEVADLPRLALEFDRKSIGRLRQMIDCINDELDPVED